VGGVLFKVDPGGIPSKMNIVPFRVKICDKCRRIWQKHVDYRSRKMVVYLPGFPKYGLKIKTCDNCLKKIKINRRG